jgi:hypothetical protein
LTGKDLAEVDFLSAQTDASATRDHDGFIAVSVPFVELEKKRAECEQIIGNEGFPSCGPFGFLAMRQVGAVGSRAHGCLEFEEN